MPEISNRARSIRPSPIRKLGSLADRAEDRGITVHHLNIGQPDIETPEPFWAGIREADIKVLAYSPSQGFAEAREAMVRYYADVGIEVGVDDLIITIGGSEAVLFAIIATLEHGDTLLIPEPFYTNYSSYARMAGVAITPITTRAQQDFRLPSRQAIESQLTPTTKAILITHPGNPTGTVYTEAELEMLREIALEHDLFLISDEVYREFVYEGSHHSVLNLGGLERHAVLVDSISKRFSACGARIGTIVSRSRKVIDSALKMAQARLSPPTLEQLGMVRLLSSETYPRQVTEMIERFKRRRDLLFGMINQIPGVVCTRPEGAFYLIVQLPVADAEDFSRWLLTDFELDGETVMLAPAAGFYETPGLGINEVRIAYVLNRKALERAVHILAAGLQTYRSRIQSDPKIVELSSEPGTRTGR